MIRGKYVLQMKVLRILLETKKTEMRVAVKVLTIKVN